MESGCRDFQDCQVVSSHGTAANCLPLAVPESLLRSSTLTLHQFARLIEVVHHHGFRIDAERVVDGCEKFAWVNGIFHGSRTGFV